MGDNGSVHELGLLSGVVDVVVQAADQRTIRRVALRVGARSGVVPEALHAAWPIASLGTVCADAELTVEHIEATVWCPTCAAEQQIDEFFALTCPVCDTPTRICATAGNSRSPTSMWSDIANSSSSVRASATALGRHV